MEKKAKDANIIINELYKLSTEKWNKENLEEKKIRYNRELNKKQN